MNRIHIILLSQYAELPHYLQILLLYILYICVCTYEYALFRKTVCKPDRVLLLLFVVFLIVVITVLFRTQLFDLLDQVRLFPGGVFVTSSLIATTSLYYNIITYTSHFYHRSKPFTRCYIL